jgi:hypothetical protein
MDLTAGLITIGLVGAAVVAVLATVGALLLMLFPAAGQYLEELHEAVVHGSPPPNE